MEMITVRHAATFPCVILRATPEESHAVPFRQVKRPVQRFFASLRMTLGDVLCELNVGHSANLSLCHSEGSARRISGWTFPKKQTPGSEILRFAQNDLMKCSVWIKRWSFRKPFLVSFWGQRPKNLGLNLSEKTNVRFRDSSLRSGCP